MAEAFSFTAADTGGKLDITGLELCETMQIRLIENGS